MDGRSPTEQHPQLLDRHWLLVNERIADTLCLLDEWVGMRVASEKDDASDEALVTKPAVGVDSARSIRAQIDIEDGKIEIMTQLAKPLLQLANALDRFALDAQQLDQLDDNRAKVLVIVQEDHTTSHSVHHFDPNTSRIDSAACSRVLRHEAGHDK
jgi:hypothetical protein